MTMDSAHHLGRDRGLTPTTQTVLYDTCASGSAVRNVYDICCVLAGTLTADDFWMLSEM